MDSNNINRPDNTNTPDIPAGNTPPDSTLPQDRPSYGNPAEIPNRPPLFGEAPDKMPDGSMCPQGRTSNGIPTGPQNQNNTSYGNPGGPQSQNTLPYGMQSGAANQNSKPYGYPNGPQNQNTSPYGYPNGPQNQNTSPYGYPNGPQNQNTNPYGNPNGTQNQNTNPYGNLNGTQNQNTNPYGNPNGTQNQNTNPYGNPNGTPNGFPNPNRNPYGAPGSQQNQNMTPPGMPNGASSYPNYYQPVQKSPANGLMTASLALGIAAIVSAILATVYFPFILGSLSIVLALLSKRNDEKMSSKSKAGITCAIVGLVLNVFVVGISLYKVFTDERTFNQFDRVYEQMYGQSFRDMYKDATGQDFPFDFD